MELFKEKFPPTLELAVNKIMSDLSRRDKTKIANMDERKLIEFHHSYGIFIKNKFRLWGNDPLLQSCCEKSGLEKISPDQASYIIIKELQKEVRESNVLRVVK